MKTTKAICGWQIQPHHQLQAITLQFDYLPNAMAEAANKSGKYALTANMAKNLAQQLMLYARQIE